MSRQRRVIILAAAASLALLAGCRSADPCGCEPPRQGLLVRLGLRSPTPVIGTTVSSAPITGGGVYSGPIYSGPISPMPGFPPPEGYGGTFDGPVLPPGGVPPIMTAPPPGTLPPPTEVPNGGGYARPIPADPAARKGK